MHRVWTFLEMENWILDIALGICLLLMAAPTCMRIMEIQLEHTSSRA